MLERRLRSLSDANEFVYLRSTNRPDIDLLTLIEAQNSTLQMFDSLSESSLFIAKVFGLDLLQNLKIWAMIPTDSPAHHEVLTVTANARRNLPKLIDVLSNSDSISDTVMIREGEGLLELIVTERSHEGSTPERIATAVSSIDTLYSVCSELTADKKEILMIGCDCGSDKSFDFLGAAKAIACLKEIILGLFDRLVFFKQQRVERDFDVIIKGLPILEKIDSAREAGTLSPEQAEIMKRKVFQGCTGFLESGCTIPELQDKSVIDVKALMVPEPRMLAQRGQDFLPGESIDQDDLNN